MIESANIALDRSGMMTPPGGGGMYLSFAEVTFMYVNSTNTALQAQEVSTDANAAYWRNDKKADIVVLISHAVIPTSPCGSALSLRPSAAQAFAAVADNGPCEYIFEHEVAHLLSADHEEATRSPANTKLYARGFSRIYQSPIEDAPYVTILTTKSAANCPSNLCERRHNFSNPAINDEWGLPTGRYSAADNARAMREEAVRVAGFR